MLRTVRSLPTGSGARIAVQIVEVAPFPWHGALCLRWDREVGPAIRADAGRCDRGWNWTRDIAVQTFVGGAMRRPRMFQLQRMDGAPLAMVALLERERWFREPDKPAVYLWYLAAAPASQPPMQDEPRALGAAALDIAVAVALDGPAEGRLWLHADPGGGPALAAWYVKSGLSVVPASYPSLPGSLVKSRPNDGRYYFLDEGAARSIFEHMMEYR